MLFLLFGYLFFLFIEGGFFALYLLTKHKPFLIFSAVMFLYLYRLLISSKFKEYYSLLILSFFLSVFSTLYIKLPFPFSFALWVCYILMLFSSTAVSIRFSKKEFLTSLFSGILIFLVLFLSIPRGDSVYVENGKERVKRLIVDLNCPHCREEIKRALEKYNLELKIVDFTKNSISNYYFLCSKEKRDALEEVISGNYNPLELVHCDLSSVSDIVLGNTREAISRGIYAVPYTY